MASSNYLQGRRQYNRPQAMLWADNSGTLSNGFYVPLGNEINGDQALTEAGEFLILTDDNRNKIDFTQKRIEQRARMINGRMRSYHVADKLTIATSWSSVPSRGYSGNPLLDTKEQIVNPIGGGNIANPNIGNPTATGLSSYTSDTGGGGVDILNWYENHTGSFWMYLAYDKYDNFTTNPYGKLGQYNEIIEVFFADFSYSVVKRGGSTYDFWDITLTLEEV